MERIDVLKARLDALRPLSQRDVQDLWDRYRAEIPTYVQGTNAIEGNSLTLGETVVILKDGLTIGGKTVKEHLETINGAKAFELMLDMAQNNRPITVNTILALHEVVVHGEPHAGAFRQDRNAITGSRHATPNWVKVPELMTQALENYQEDLKTRHPVVSGAKLHFNIAKIHPFVDGNGRTARLVNNLHLIQHGYPPVLLRLEERAEYVDALEQSHGLEDDTTPPAPFILFMMKMEEQSLHHYLKALNIERGEPEININLPDGHSKGR